MKTRAEIERELRHLQDQVSSLLAEKEILDSFPAEPSVGSVISFTQTFTNRSTSRARKAGPTYTYAAIHTPVGWYMTGKQTIPTTWERLWEFIAKDPEAQVKVYSSRQGKTLPVSSPKETTTSEMTDDFVSSLFGGGDYEYGN